MRIKKDREDRMQVIANDSLWKIDEAFNFYINLVDFGCQRLCRRLTKAIVNDFKNGNEQNKLNVTEKINGKEKIERWNANVNVNR